MANKIIENSDIQDTVGSATQNENVNLPSLDYENVYHSKIVIGSTKKINHRHQMQQPVLQKNTSDSKLSYRKTPIMEERSQTNSSKAENEMYFYDTNNK